MKRFHFSLQPVARLRAHQEVRAQEAFGAAVQAFLRTEEFLVASRARVAQFEASLTAGRQGRFSAADQGPSLLAYRQETAAEAASEQAMLAARATMAQRRAEYLQAHRKVEVIKRLEDKARAKYRQECGHEEQAGFDDFAGRQAHARKTTTAV